MLSSVFTVSLKRIISASPLQVFEAWTDPAMLLRWLAPPPYRVREVSTDLREGGRYSIEVVGPEGDVHLTTGEYLELKPGEKLVKTWLYSGPSRRDTTPSVVTVELRPAPAGETELTLTHSQLPADAASRGVSAGWALCLDQMQLLLRPAEDKNSI